VKFDDEILEKLHGVEKMSEKKRLQGDTLMTQHMEKEKTAMSVMTAFIVGGLIGAGVALLMAPQSGEETRKMIKQQAEETRHRAEDAADDIAHQTRVKAEELRRQGKQVVERGRSNIEEEMRRH
jgi:gas vesicle protein